MLEYLQRLRFYAFAALVVLPPALGCLWVLLVRLGGPAPAGGWLWWFSVAVAPWWLLGASAPVLFGAGWRYVLHRRNPQTERTEKLSGHRAPAPRPVRERGLVGLTALLLAAAVLWPRHLPEGALVWESTAVQSLLVADTARWEDGKFVTDRADHLVYTCTYLSVYGLVTETHALRPSYPRPCAYFYRRSP